MSNEEVFAYPKPPGLARDGRIRENEDMGAAKALLPTGGYPTAAQTR